MYSVYCMYMIWWQTNSVLLIVCVGSYLLYVRDDLDTEVSGLLKMVDKDGHE